jgi:ParB-like chromosome segregation protein Spo0J
MRTVEKYQLLPALPPEQFEALKADIAERGVIVPVIVDEFGIIIDGHNRARACRELGKNDYPVEVQTGLSEEEKRALSRKLNALRRHLSRDEVRQLIAEQVKETPTWSNARLAAGLGVDDKTVAAVREHLEATSEIPRLEKLTGADGKTRPRKLAKRPLTIDHDDDDDDDFDDDEDDHPAKKGKREKPEYTDKELDDLWAGKGKLAAMKKRAFEHAKALMEQGVPGDSPVVMGLLKDASIPFFGTNNTFETPGYDPFFGRSETEILEWHLFMLFLVRQCGWPPDGASQHVEWLLRRPFQNVADWLDDDKWREQQRMATLKPELKNAWRAFADEQENRTKDDIVQELERVSEEVPART